MQRPKVVGHIVLTCVVLHNILRTNQGRLDRAPNPTDDIVAIANETAVYVQEENHKNPLREAKHQLLKRKTY